MSMQFDEAWLRDFLARGGKIKDGQELPKSVERLMQVQSKRTQKYGNIKVEEDGMMMDSKHEAAVYRELKAQLSCGDIIALARQVTFMLPGNVRYIADFVAFRPDGSYDVIDAKSEATRKNAVYVIKRKQMKACHGVTIIEK